MGRKASALGNINTAYLNTVHNHANQYDILTICPGKLQNTYEAPILACCNHLPHKLVAAVNSLPRYRPSSPNTIWVSSELGGNVATDQKHTHGGKRNLKCLAYG